MSLFALTTPRVWRAVLASITALVTITGALLVPQTPVRAAAQPAGTPSHFAFGVGAGQGDTWMPGTGIAWDYRMQYLAGGVNTGTGWETWNANGTFPLSYAQESGQHGYIPVFPYYELLQSTGSCGTCNENEKDITNLNTPALMQAYFSNFALLMKRLGPGTYDSISGYGKPAVVNLEPDFTGGYAYQAAIASSQCFGYCTAQGNDPSYLEAAVGSSGFADVAAYPNTYAGYVQALAHLRDLYAPNVVFGLDVSAWGAGPDIGMDTNPSIDAAGLGQQLGTFLSKTGPHDVLFNNPLDRDAGQYKAVYGQNRWWDRLNVTFPNFHRWEQFLQATGTADTGRSVLLWQVPVGNQYFNTENNTTNHYQDNRPEYIFSHVAELIQAGIVGAIFAPGNGGNTNYYDADKDGVVNPASFCTTDGTSSGQICNTHSPAAGITDDDGGYLRMSAQAYYQSPVALSGGSIATSTATPTTTATSGSSTGTPTPTRTPGSTPTTRPTSYTLSRVASPATVAHGAKTTLTVTVNSGAASKVLVDVEVYNSAGVNVYQQAWDNQSFNAGQTRTFRTTWSVPATIAPGTYTIAIGIFSPGWGTLYEWSSTAGTVTVT